MLKNERMTKETKIQLELELQGKGQISVQTGIGFFDHMLTALGVHAGWDMSLDCEGDLWVDGHHSVEDIGIVLGKTLKEGFGDKSRIARYGLSYIPMDEALARSVVDISGRPYLVFHGEFTSPMVGDFDVQLVEEFFRAVAMNAGLTLHLEVLYGKNDHHKIEALFKAFAHSMKMALEPNEGRILSSKGVLE